MIDLNFFSGWALSFAILLIRYFVIAGAAFLIFYKILNSRFIKNKIQHKNISPKKIKFEIISSLSTFVIFASLMSSIIFFTQQGITKIYSDFHAQSLLYFICSFFFLIFIHDTYFYWIHRMMHLPFFFKKIHTHHHRSHSPTPWAAFSFHPVEAFLEFIFILPIVFILPLHPLTLFLFALAMTSMNVLGHLGYELFPKTFLQKPAGKILNTTTHHDMHHQYANANFGLYFNLWDRLMGTNHKKYKQTFEQIKGKK